MYFCEQLLNEGIIFWFKNIYNHYKRKENKEMTMDQAFNKLLRSMNEFEKDNYKKNLNLIYQKAHQEIDKYVNRCINLINQEELEVEEVPWPFPVNCKELEKKIHLRKYFKQNYLKISNIFHDCDDDLYSLIFYKTFSHELFKSSFGATIAIPLVIYGRNNESNIIFVTFDDEQLYSLFTVIAPNNGEDGLNTCHLLKLSNIYIRRDK